MRLLKERPRREREREFTTFFRRHHTLVWSAAWRSGAREDIIDDVVQETFLLALCRGEGGKEVNAGWLVRAARYTTLNHLRTEYRRTRRQRDFFELMCPDDPTGDGPQRLLAQSLLEEFLSSLSARRRRVFLLSEVGGFSSREIGEMLSAKATTVRSILRQVRVDFAARFEQDARSQVVAALACECPEPGRARREQSLRALLLLGGGPVAPAPASASVKVMMVACVGASGIAAAVASILAGVPGLGQEPTERSLDLALGEGRGPSVEGAPHSREPDEAAHGRARAASGRARAASGRPSRGSELAGQGSELAARGSRERARAGAKRPEPRAGADELSDYRKLGDAREAMFTGRSQETLAILRSYGEWSSLELERKALYLELGALCRLHRGGEAQRRAERWGEIHPQVAMDVRVQGLCW